MGMKDVAMLMGLEPPKSQKYPAKKAGRKVTPLTDGDDEPAIAAEPEQHEALETFTAAGVTYTIDRTTPRPPRRSSPGSSYDALFDALKIGQSVLCETPQQALKIAGALRSYLQRKDKPHLAPGLESRCPDGKSRVYLVVRKEAKK